MFVTKRKYTELLNEYYSVLVQLKKAIIERNEIATMANRLAREVDNRLKDVKIVDSSSIVIDKKDLKKILMLVHPDKHQNSKLSNDVTAMLLEKSK